VVLGRANAESVERVVIVIDSSGKRPPFRAPEVANVQKGDYVWAPRGSLTARALVQDVTGPKAWVKARDGFVWMVDIALLTPCVDSGEAGRSSVEGQREIIKKASIHLQAARRLAADHAMDVMDEEDE